MSFQSRARVLGDIAAAAAIYINGCMQQASKQTIRCPTCCHCTTLHCSVCQAWHCMQRTSIAHSQRQKCVFHHRSIKNRSQIHVIACCCFMLGIQAWHCAQRTSSICSRCPTSHNCKPLHHAANSLLSSLALQAHTADIRLFRNFPTPSNYEQYLASCCSVQWTSSTCRSWRGTGRTSLPSRKKKHTTQEQLLKTARQHAITALW